MEISATYTAFEGSKKLFSGSLAEIVLKIKKRIGKADHSSVVIFSDSTGKTIDFNFQGSERDVERRLEIFVDEKRTKESVGPGRPKLGVVSREVSLLPRHWEWLASQSGGASATLRNLIEEAKKKSAAGSQVKQAQERTYKIMHAVAGDFRGFEEALRALYKKDQKMFLEIIVTWPKDISDYIKDLSEAVFQEK
jgi:uncharacterized protein